MTTAKRIFALLIAAASVLALVSCGGTKPKEPPTAGGVGQQVYELHFETPKGTVKNPYNGFLETWEFYTDDFGMPGVDIMLMVSDLDGETLEYYVKNESRPANSEGVTPFKKETINGDEWYTCNNGTIWYFASTPDGEYIFEIEVKSVAGDPDDLRGKAISMLYKTLYFEIEEGEEDDVGGNKDVWDDRDNRDPWDR